MLSDSESDDEQGTQATRTTVPLTIFDYSLADSRIGMLAALVGVPALIINIVIGLGRPESGYFHGAEIFAGVASIHRAMLGCQYRSFAMDKEGIS